MKKLPDRIQRIEVLTDVVGLGLEILFCYRPGWSIVRALHDRS
jgi:hypothetical protein